MPISPGDLSRIRSQVGKALDDFIERRRASLSSIGPELGPCADAVTDLPAGGKMLRAAFCH